jgi:hypothetical protein
MATKHEVILVGFNPATEIVPALGGNGRDVTIQNQSTSAVFLGGEGVDNNNYGFVLQPGAAISFELDGVDAIYGWAVNGASNVSVLSINLEKVRNG